MGPHQRQRNTSLTLEAFSKLLSSCATPRDRILLRVLFETGCSVSDAATLKPAHYLAPAAVTDNHALRFLDPPRQSIISAPLARALQEFIQDRKRAPDEFLFSQKPLKPFSVKRIEQILAQLAREHAQDITPQAIRYLHVCHAARRGLSPDSIAAHTGLTRGRVLQILDAYGVSYAQSYSRFFDGDGDDAGGAP